MTTVDPRLRQLALTVAGGDLESVVNLTRNLLEAGVSAEDVLKHGLLRGIQNIGEEFRHNQVYVPEVMLAGMAMRGGLDVLRTVVVKSSLSHRGKVLLATCFGDVHDLGKVLVGIMLEGAGFEVRDLGVNVPADRIVAEISDFRPHIVGLAVGMTTTLTSMRWTIKVLNNSEFRRKFRVMVGGMPLTRELALQMGADGYAPDAVSAVAEAQRLMSTLKATETRARAKR